MSKLELLAPAKNSESGKVAIDYGADAVYIGAPMFGARSAAGNSLNDIRSLIGYAHKYWAKVYVTVNTLLFDEELSEAEKLITNLYEIGADAIIFQDLGLLKLDLPPIQLFASTQTHNYDIERIKFLDSLGIQRIILARELTLDQIEQIKNSTKSDLEFFIHGALCVCFSGQCYFSQAICGKSANRGECVQPCRVSYDLIDSQGKIIVKDKHLLSLKDLNLSAYLNDLIQAGITSFKIEGRLKDQAYVKNVVSYYRKKIDDIIYAKDDLERASHGRSNITFEPDPDKTFNRGYSKYFIGGRKEKTANINTPKSMGKLLGKVSKLFDDSFIVDTTEVIVNGDGICFLNKDGKLQGFSVSRVNANRIYLKEKTGLTEGTDIYRNFDKKFNDILETSSGERRIDIDIIFSERENGFTLVAEDEYNNIAKLDITKEKVPAQNPQLALDTIKKQMRKSGDSIFQVKEILINTEEAYFLRVSELNDMRRELLAELDKERLKNYTRELTGACAIRPKYFQSAIDYRANVVNEKSREFYLSVGVEEVSEGFEKQTSHYGMEIMRCRYCIKEQIDLCPKTTDGKINLDEPLYLLNNKKKYRLQFNCEDCEMSIIID